MIITDLMVIHCGSLGPSKTSEDTDGPDDYLALRALRFAFKFVSDCLVSRYDFIIVPCLFLYPPHLLSFICLPVVDLRNFRTSLIPIHVCLVSFMLSRSREFPFDVSFPSDS